MTAILISRKVTPSSDTLYVFTDGRTTGDDKIYSDRNKKVFSFPATKERPYKRHYVTVGDVAPTDYIIHKLEKVDSKDRLYELVFETDSFLKIPHSATVYIINELPSGVEVIQLTKEKDEVGITHIDLEELVDYPISDGSGGLYVKVALDALEIVNDSTSYISKVKLAFFAAAHSINSINDIVSIIEIPIKSKKVKGNTKNERI